MNENHEVTYSSKRTLRILASLFAALGILVSLQATTMAQEMGTFQRKGGKPADQKKSKEENRRLQAGPESTPANVSRGDSIGDILPTNGMLQRGQRLISKNGQYIAVYQTDGDFVVYGSGRLLWRSQTAGRDGDRLVMQGDGNLVIYKGSTPVWATNTVGGGAAYLVMQDDGNLVIYKHGGGPLWASSAAGPAPAPANVMARGTPTSQQPTVQQPSAQRPGIQQLPAQPTAQQQTVQTRSAMTIAASPAQQSPQPSPAQQQAAQPAAQQSSQAPELQDDARGRRDRHSKKASAEQPAAQQQPMDSKQDDARGRGDRHSKKALAEQPAAQQPPAQPPTQPSTAQPQSAQPTTQQQSVQQPPVSQSLPQQPPAQSTAQQPPAQPSTQLAVQSAPPQQLQQSGSVKTTPQQQAPPTTPAQATPPLQPRPIPIAPAQMLLEQPLQKGEALPKRNLTFPEYNGVPPTGVQIVGTTQTTATLRWQAAPGATGYRVHHEGGYPVEVPSGSTSTLDRGLAPGTTYSWSVEALYPDGKIGMSSPVSGKTLPPTNPSTFQAKVTGPDEVTLSWTPVPEASRYWINAIGWGGDGVLHPTTTYTVKGLKPGTYDFGITARYMAGGSDETNIPIARITIAPPPRQGRYRVTFTGFWVNHETLDHALEWDGKRDEVFVSTDVRILDINGNQVIPGFSPAERSHVFGDTWRNEGRIQAGTASELGGLKTNDHYPDDPYASTPLPGPRYLPLKLWEGNLTEGQNAVVVTPTIWEYDGSNNADAFNGWIRWIQNTAQQLGKSETVTALVGGEGKMYIDLTDVIAGVVLSFVEGVLGRDADRPIGVHNDGSGITFKPQSLALNYKNIETFLSQGHEVAGLPRGVFPLNYVDTGAWGGGNYTIYIKIERL